MTTQQVLALLVSISFGAGVNVYATVATLGLLARAGVVELPGALDPITSWWVIGASLALFAIEFFADKLPYVDLVWNVLQTFVRVCAPRFEPAQVVDRARVVAFDRVEPQPPVRPRRQVACTGHL